MSFNLLAGISVGFLIGLGAINIWNNVAIERVETDRRSMRQKIRFYLRTGAITPDMASELHEKIWAVDFYRHAHYVRTFRDPRVLYPSELSW